MNSITIKNQTIKRFLKLIALSVCLFLGQTMFAQTEASTVAQGELSFENDTIDYGTIAHNADGNRTFKFENTGNAPIVISKVKTSCGCTVPTYPKTAVLPGETGEIKVHYATNRVGVFSKTLTVFSNATEGNKALKIKGEVLKEAQ
jgi:hypothetical protein